MSLPGNLKKENSLIYLFICMAKKISFYEAISLALFGGLSFILTVPQYMYAEDISSSTTTIDTATSTTTDTNTVAKPPNTISLTIRYQDEYLFTGEIPLVTTTYTDITSNSTHSLDATSTVFSSLVIADSISDNFTLSDAQLVQFAPGLSSFYVRCLTLTQSSSTLACDNWNYVVNGIYPNQGMDAYTLTGDEEVYIYFSDSWKITASTSTFPLGTTTTLETFRYDYSNLSNPWTADPFTVIDIGVPNPNSIGFWDATITADTTSTGEFGSLEYLFAATGTYYAKITTSDFSKWSFPITVHVTDALLVSTTTSSTTSTENQTTGGSGGSGGSGSNNQSSATISQDQINAAVTKIISFLTLSQDTTGKIIDGTITDWSLMSFGANGIYGSSIKASSTSPSLLDFTKAYTLTDASDLNSCAGYPRHLLALLAAGVPTTDSTVQNMITGIKSSACYTNHTFGQTGINDDVFALLALLAIDTPVSDSMITDIITTITGDQTQTGAFTWAGFPGADITGAAINALQYAKNKGASLSQTIFDKAKTYLKNEQLADGGWGFGTSDVLTTSWAVMGIHALGENQNQWSTAQGKNPWSVLVSGVTSAGYYESAWVPGTVDWFGTKHAVPALLGKTWPIILAPQTTETISSSNGGGAGSGLTTLSPTTTIIATTTPNSTPTTTTFIVTSTESQPIITFITSPTATEDVLPSSLPESVSIPILPLSAPRTAPLNQPTTSELTTSPANTAPTPLRISSPSTTESLIAANGSTPLQKTAKGVFGGAVTMAGGMGLYLAWRFVQTLL